MPRLADLPAASALSDVDLLLAVQSGVSTHATVGQVKDRVLADGGTFGAPITLLGTPAGSVRMDSAAGVFRFARYMTNGVVRWDVGVDAGSETGANAGAGWFWNAWSDDGGTILPRLTITRSSGAILPGVDNAQTFGSGSKRLGQIYSGTGTINTSDAREKEWRGALTSSELSAAKRIGAEIGTYKFLAAIAAKGDAARTHVGLRAQTVRDILADEGLEPLDYGFLCHDAWDELPGRAAVFDDGVLVMPAVEATPAGDRWGLRIDELALFLVAAQEARLAALEAV